MSTLYWDPFSGIAGNMAVASLLDLGADLEKLRAGLEGIPFPEGRLGLVCERRLKNGIDAFYFNTVDDEHWDAHHSHLQGHDHDHDHDHDHAHGYDHGHSHAHEHDHEQGNGHGHHHHGDHGHDHGDNHHGPLADHDHGHCHHDHDQEPDHEQDHGHEPGHRHGDHAYDHGFFHAHDHAHDHGTGHLPHRGLSDVRALIEAAPISAGARERALAIFRALAEAEARVHGATVESVHFHEVGARDSIADIVGVAICLDDLDVTEHFVSPIHLGTGFTRCQHGTFPVPPPATAWLLREYPVFQEPGVRGELTTPTGAAILRGLGAKPGLPPGFVFDRIGYGAGTREFGIPNVLRTFLSRGSSSRRRLEGVVSLETNLDNVTGELLAHVSELAIDAGALDVSLTPIQMKKGRPGTRFTALVAPAAVEAIETLLYRELPTLGIRRVLCQRSVLERETIEIPTTDGTLPGKRIHEIDGLQREVAEVDARRELARRTGRPLRRIPGGTQN